MPRTRSLLIAIAMAFAACSRMYPDAVSGPVQMLVLAYDAAASRYALSVQTVTTMHLLRRMEGGAGQFIGGAKLHVDYDALAAADPLPASHAALEAATATAKGQPVDFAYLSIDGIVHPEDGDSLVLATTYYNLEVAQTYFANLQGALGPLLVYFQPELQEGPAANMVVQKNTSAWNPYLHALVVQPPARTDVLPYSMNQGIIVREYAKAIYQARVFPGEGLPRLLADATTNPSKFGPALNRSRSFSEGIADYFGAVMTGDTQFLERSYPDTAAARRVDPALPACMTYEMLQKVAGVAPDQYDPYPLGTVLAATLWDISQRAQSTVDFNKALLAGMTQIGTRTEIVSLSEYVDSLVSQLPEDVKSYACGQLLDRFILPPSDVPNCRVARAAERPCQL